MAEKMIIGMQVNDEPGVAARVIGLFARRGYNIETLTAGREDSSGKSKIFMSVTGDTEAIMKISKQVGKLLDVTKVRILAESDSIIQEMCLVKVAAPNHRAKELLLEYAEVNEAAVVFFEPETITLRIVGDTNKVESFLQLMNGFGIIEVSRTGLTAIFRGNSGNGYHERETEGERMKERRKKQKEAKDYWAAEADGYGNENVIEDWLWQGVE